jgi:predicted NBD/HSP70 family sugar kinase
MPARLFRERVVLTELRRLRQASKTDIANGTRFALQTVVDIVNRLEEEGLVRKIGRRLGRVGQPSILYGINPDGVFGLGLSVRRSKCDLVVVDFEGRIRERLARDHDLPHFEVVRAFLADGVAEMSGRPDWRGRICGLGVALSHDLWYQPLRQGLPDEIVTPWRDKDVAAEFHAAIGLPVFVENDTRVAAVAEYLLGEGQDFDKFLHVVIGPHISGALVLGGSLETGAHGRAGTLGAIPVGPSRLAHARDDASANRLGTRASLAGLMRHLGLHGFTIRAVAELPEVLDQARGLVQEWLDDCVEALVEGLTACFAVIDVEAVIIDSELPQFLVMEIVEKLGRRMAAADADHVVVPQLRLSRLGADGALIGGAILPINAHFFPTREAFAAEQSADVQPSRRGKKTRSPKS